VSDSPTAEGACEMRSVHPEAVAHARRRLPDATGIEGATSLLKAVADPTRFRILVALAGAELCVCDLAAVLRMSESAVSHQLRLLRTSRLVTFRKAGRVAYYRLLDDHVVDVIVAAMEHAREA
jgi:ArsR family transcriptional regulator, lead/cadmium/zinc/bismuth-responsive transcriptional repressor